MNYGQERCIFHLHLAVIFAVVLRYVSMADRWEDRLSSELSKLKKNPSNDPVKWKRLRLWMNNSDKTFTDAAKDQPWDVVQSLTLFSYFEWWNHEKEISPVVFLYFISSSFIFTIQPFNSRAQFFDVSHNCYAVCHIFHRSDLDEWASTDSTFFYLFFQFLHSLCDPQSLDLSYHNYSTHSTL